MASEQWDALLAKIYYQTQRNETAPSSTKSISIRLWQTSEGHVTGVKAAFRQPSIDQRVFNSLANPPSPLGTGHTGPAGSPARTKLREGMGNWGWHGVFSFEEA